jgi:hypothetical protein
MQGEAVKPHLTIIKRLFVLLFGKAYWCNFCQNIYEAKNKVVLVPGKKNGEVGA